MSQQVVFVTDVTPPPPPPPPPLHRPSAGNVNMLKLNRTFKQTQLFGYQFVCLISDVPVLRIPVIFARPGYEQFARNY